MMPEEELSRRLLELAKAGMCAVIDIQAAGPDWHAVVHRLSILGHSADALLADYYDAMTPQEIEAEFDTGEQVPVEATAEGIRIGFYSSFSRSELAELRKWESDRPMGDVVHDAALSFVREHEGVRVALARLKGSEPTRAEILTGLTLREEPPQAPSALT